jgi:hypothetical protein
MTWNSRRLILRMVSGRNLPPARINDPAFQFAKHTRHWMHEWLDKHQYDLTKNAPDSVSFQEGLRDIGLIRT